ncbi:MAG TPA: 6-carboxytetrahydropterin synthase [Alphaproteobacteria bacterium]
MARYFATKTYSPERGFSCTFRQWRADSHCKFLHGYALGVKMIFASEELDERHWVYDFGGLKWVKAFLEEHFDHTTCIAADDPELTTFKELDAKGLIQLRVLPAIGCESFAKFIYDFIQPRVVDETEGRVVLHSIEVFEHSGNSAVYQG